jgi:hypothetical protein
LMCSPPVSGCWRSMRAASACRPAACWWLTHAWASAGSSLRSSRRGRPGGEQRRRVELRWLPAAPSHPHQFFVIDFEAPTCCQQACLAREFAYAEHTQHSFGEGSC